MLDNVIELDARELFGISQIARLRKGEGSSTSARLLAKVGDENPG